MKSLIIVLTLLVSILGVISKDLSSSGNDVKFEEPEMLADENILDMDLDRKKKPAKRCWIRGDGMRCCKKRGKTMKCKPSKPRNGGSCNNALVVTGGNTNLTRFSSSDLISYLGVCWSPNIPQLPEAITAGASTWLDSEKSLMFCGGSNTFLGNQPVPTWSSIDTCWKLNPGADAWIPSSNMLFKRGQFSLNSINGGEAVAAGGLDDDTILDTLEMYSGGAWQELSFTLKEPVFAHCAVHYTLGGHSYLMIIGGKTMIQDTYANSQYVYTIDLNNGAIVNVDLGDLPPLSSPACVIDCEHENIYVSGGGMDDGSTSNGVYTYNIMTSTQFTLLGHLNNPRLGHTMGVTALGQMVVAGGWDYPAETYLTSIESSTDDGVTWNERSPGLSEKKEYAAMASVPALTFAC